MDNLFIEASRKKLRFATPKNLAVTTEDLWDLPLTHLDSTAIAISEELEKTSKKSFLTPKSTANTELNLRLEVLKHVITTRQEETEKKKLATEKQQEIAMLEELLADKHTEGLKALTPEQIQAKLDKLKGS